MSLWESISSSWQAIYTNKMRSILTILGIVIGVGAVVFLISFGQGQQAQMTETFEEMGANALYITNASTNVGGKVNLTLEDAEALSNPNRAPSIKVVAPMSIATVNIAYGNENLSQSVSGVTPEIAQVRSYPVTEGNFISQIDIRKKTDVAVLGYQTALDLFGSANPVGESIRISGRRFEVIGIIEELGGMGPAVDSYALIPLTTMQARIITQTSARGHPVQTIAVQAVSTDQIDSAKEQATTILRQRHHIREGEDNDFNIIDMRDILDTMKEALGIFAIFLSSVGAISLLVGGIGIMNIMLVSVTERTREIGIRKAIGAKRRDILRQFLVESAVLSLSGGIIGLLIASSGALLISSIDLGFPTNFIMSPTIVIVVLGVSIGIGLVSGTYPAVRAARLDPIEALRHE